MTRTPATNTGFASGGVTCKLGALCFYLSSVLVDSFVLRNPPERKARKRSEEIPSGFPRYGSGLHTSSTALRDCPRTWVSRKRETCVKPRAVAHNYKKNPTNINMIRKYLTILLIFGVNLIF